VTEMRGEFLRGSEEFSRVLAFSDGLFAIAMTLLVVGIAVPDLVHSGDQSELLDALNDLVPAIISFFISFVVIGRYWVAHHQFFRALRAMDYRLIWVNLVYLAFVAFLPFPTALLGNYFENPLAVASYAVIVAMISGLEVVLFRRAHDDGLLAGEIPDEVYRWGVTASTLPVLFLVASVPIAFLSTGLAVATWFLSVPVQILWLNRRMPPNAADWF
jgi:TMEM175 potassium channel family protein